MGRGSEHWETIEQERLALADLLDTLLPRQWEAQSLCGGWTVADVVTHLAGLLTGGAAAVARAAVRARGDLHAANRATVAAGAGRHRAELVEDLRTHAASHVHPPGMGSRAPLAEVMLHRLDIAVPLGLTVDRPDEPWAPVLDFLTSPQARLGFVPRGRPRVSLGATDLSWASGDAPDVVGPAASLALVLSGRPTGLTCLAGPGLPTLTTWVRARGNNPVASSG
ncbi:maleylpyruvate isomerase family mycothiol-dependent enzyme [Nocardioides korecus]